MSDRDKSSVTPEEFSRYIEQRVPVFKCEVCDTQDWILLVDPSEMQSGPVYLSTVNAGGRQLSVLSSCVVACKICGNMKYFLRDHVQQWLEEHPRG